MTKGSHVWLYRPWTVGYYRVERAEVSFVDDDGLIWVKGVPYDPETLVSTVGRERHLRTRISERSLPRLPKSFVSGGEVFIRARDAPV
jgi:hypothetical protein